MSQFDQSHLVWRKSSYSNGEGCVEASPLADGMIGVRDSKNPDGGYLVYNAHEWRAFLAGVRNGEFDYLAPPLAPVEPLRPRVGRAGANHTSGS